jgi:regulator of protease activity HflC (stomatin/prohibitin superfamily)
MTALLVMGIIGLGVAAFIWQTNKGSAGDASARRWGGLGIIAAGVVIVASLLMSTFVTIPAGQPAGQRGVVIRFSAVTGRVLEEGLQTKMPFLESVVRMSVQTQKYEADSSAVTNDLQDVSTTIALNWRLDPGQALPPFRRSSSR